ncbi:phage lysozyme family protein [Brucella rhizosphaerae]|uniref:Lysozyme n=2 Tax=Brucella rhizosphaerae TaxID=571254 RepID=A0A256F919_9HYPH|nr:phage lysozyme family protein [Brucella rhizosphaerae]
MQFDLPTYEAAVKRLVKVPLTENQYGALVSFTYNLGETNLSKSTLLKRINSRAPIAEIERSWLQWNKAGGKVLNGLTRRRQAEVALFKR